MGCDYYIYDNSEEEFIGISCSDLETAEKHIEKELSGDYERYTIYKKET